MKRLDPAVASLLRTVSAEVVMPSFRVLAADQIVEKEPGDMVTVADLEAEKRLIDGLSAILPEARVVGEEGAAADPTMLESLDKGLVWIVDPIDGTGNYADGRSPFALMVALAADGDVKAGWIFDPVADRMLSAFSGEVAFANGERVFARATQAAEPLLALATRFLPPAFRDAFETRAAGRLTPVAIPMCAGEQYARLALAENDVALFWRAHPWDHAPGGLFLEEAGGRLARFDGSPYRIKDRRIGLLAAATPTLWDQAARILLNEPLPPLPAG